MEGHTRASLFGGTSSRRDHMEHGQERCSVLIKPGKFICACKTAAPSRAVSSSGAVLANDLVVPPSKFGSKPEKETVKLI